jgi:hypothetical protein
MEVAYHVECQPVAEEELLGLYLDALQRGITEPLESAARQIDLELKWHPLTFGEPHYRHAACRISPCRLYPAVVGSLWCP